MALSWIWKSYGKANDKEYPRHYWKAKQKDLSYYTSRLIIMIWRLRQCGMCADRQGKHWNRIEIQIDKTREQKWSSWSKPMGTWQVPWHMRRKRIVFSNGAGTTSIFKQDTKVLNIEQRLVNSSFKNLTVFLVIKKII